MLTAAQLTALRAYIDAATDPAIVAARTPATRADYVIANWLNEPSATLVWNEATPARDVFEAINVGKFDTLSAGKRDAMRMMLDFAPVNFTRQKNRNAIIDIWGAADSVAVLGACRRPALRCEEAFGGTTRTTSNNVSAINLNRAGSVTMMDVADALNMAV